MISSAFNSILREMIWLLNCHKTTTLIECCETEGRHLVNTNSPKDSMEMLLLDIVLCVQPESSRKQGTG